MERNCLTVVAVIAALVALGLCAVDPGAGLGLLILLAVIGGTLYWLATRDSQPRRTAAWTREDKEMLAFMMFDDALDEWDE